MFFIRFTNQPEADLERGFSFAGYMLFDTREQAIEEFSFLDGDDFDEGLVAQDNTTGMWGRRLSGLCGFGGFDSVEEATEAIPEYEDRMYYNPQTAVVFEGVDSWDSSIDGSDDEGARFAPTKIVWKA